MIKKRVSLRDIAQAAGISHATVSLALRDSPMVAAATKRRVKELVASMGYVPDPMLRMLAEYRRSKGAPSYHATLGWINNYRNPGELEAWRDFRLHHQGAEDRARELGYQVEPFFPRRDGMRRGQLEKILRHRGIPGLLLPPQQYAHTEWDIELSDFAAVTFGNTLASPALHAVANNFFQSGQLIVRLLRRCGFARIGFFATKVIDSRTEHAFLGGYLAEQAAVKSKNRIPHRLIDWDEGTAAIVTEFLEWRSRHAVEVAIVDSPELMTHLRAAGVDVPDDVSLAYLSTWADAAGCAGINQNAYEVGRAAVDTLVGMLYRNEKGVPDVPQRTLINGTWQDGESVRPPR